MSKKLDTSDLSALSQEDLQYLAARGQLTPDEKVQYIEGYDGLGDPPVFGLHGGLIDPTAGSVPAPEPEGEEEGEEDETEGGEGEEGGEEEDETEYSEFSKDDLKAELDSRKIEYKASANKEELIALLEADDEEEED